MNNKHPYDDAASESRQATNPFPHFAHYDVLDELGRGGFGTVYLALDMRLERMVALKVLHANLAADLTIVERFKREAKALARLAHPNIVMVYSVEDEGPSPFIVMEYVEGLTLERKLLKGAWSVKEAIHILWQVAEALDAAHEQGLIHRDIKPSNILITRQKQVKLTDFGIAKMREAEENPLTSTNMTLGTVRYMAPEQSNINRQHEIGPAVDIYALGVVAYEMLAGRVPFKGDTHAVLLAHHIELPPDPSTWGADVSPSVLRVLRRVLAKDPGERYATATQFIEMLAQAASRDGIDLRLKQKPLSEEQLMASDSAQTQTLHSIDPTGKPTGRPTRPLFDPSKDRSTERPQKSGTAAKDHSKHESSTRQWVTPQESRGSAYDAASDVASQMPYHHDQPTSRRQQTPSHNQPINRQQTPSQNQPINRQQTPSHNQPINRQQTPSHNQPINRQQTPSHNQPINRQQTPSHHQPSRREQSPSYNQPSRREQPPISHQPSRREQTPSQNQAVIPSRLPARRDQLPPVPAKQEVVVVHRVERSIIWSTLSTLGKLLGGILSFLSQLVLIILRGWPLMLLAGLLLFAVITFRTISLPEISGPDQIILQWEQNITIWWQETVVQPWNEFRTGVESQVTESMVEEWAEQGGMDEISQAITDTLTAIETAATDLASQNAPPTALSNESTEGQSAPTEIAVAPTEISVAPVEEPLAPTEAPAQAPVEAPVASTEVSVAATEISIPPTAIPTFPFRPAFVGPDFSQGCPGFYVFGYVRDSSGNLLSGVRVRAVNEYQANIPAVISKEEPLGEYDIVISENEAYWQVQVIDADNNPLSEIVTVFNSGNYVEGSEACRHQVDFERVN